MTPEVAVAFHQAVRVPRSALYGVEIDPQLPAELQDDARVPFLGFCGPRYQPGNPVLLAINPGGGKDNYVDRHGRDEELIPLIQAFVRADPKDARRALARMSETYMVHAQAWNVGRIIMAALGALGKDIDEICFLNIFPYRTAGNALPRARPLLQAWQQVQEPLLHVLRPSVVIALGKKAGDALERAGGTTKTTYVVPRTNGDHYLSAEALRVLGHIRREMGTIAGIPRKAA